MAVHRLLLLIPPVMGLSKKNSCHWFLLHSEPTGGETAGFLCGHSQSERQDGLEHVGLSRQPGFQGELSFSDSLITGEFSVHVRSVGTVCHLLIESARHCFNTLKTTVYVFISLFLRLLPGLHNQSGPHLQSGPFYWLHLQLQYGSHQESLGRGHTWEPTVTLHVSWSQQHNCVFERSVFWSKSFLIMTVFVIIVDSTNLNMNAFYFCDRSRIYSLFPSNVGLLYTQSMFYYWWNSLNEMDKSRISRPHYICP